MEKKNLVGQIHNSIYQNVNIKGWVAPVDVLIDIGILSKADYESWRLGKVDYLERVCTVNLHKLSEIMKIIRVFAGKNNLKPSLSVYNQWACKDNRKLRFSKSGQKNIEDAYATHYVGRKLIDEKRARKQESGNE